MIPVIGVGLALQPDDDFLGLLDEAIRRDVDFYEVTPETLWWEEDDGSLRGNSFFHRLVTLKKQTNKPVVGHGVGLSLSGQSRRDEARRKRWLSRIAEDHKSLQFAWYTDHLGISAPAGMAATLPLPVWQTESSARFLTRQLRRLQNIVPLVGVENSVFYFTPQDPLREPAFLKQALAEQGMHLLLDLHNVYTTAQNVGFDPVEYLQQIDFDLVIELHLSGGTMSDASWLPSGKSLRLDSHDDGIPDRVWELFDWVLPRCPKLKGVTLERMEGTVKPHDVPLIREELHRIKATLIRQGLYRG